MRSTSCTPSCISSSCGSPVPPPTAPMTVRVAPSIDARRIPCPINCATTAWICASVARSSITTTMSVTCFLSFACCHAHDRHPDSTPASPDRRRAAPPTASRSSRRASSMMRSNSRLIAPWSSGPALADRDVAQDLGFARRLIDRLPPLLLPAADLERARRPLVEQRDQIAGRSASMRRRRASRSSLTRHRPFQPRTKAPTAARHVAPGRRRPAHHVHERAADDRGVREAADLLDVRPATKSRIPAPPAGAVTARIRSTSGPGGGRHRLPGAGDAQPRDRVEKPAAQPRRFAQPRVRGRRADEENLVEAVCGEHPARRSPIPRSAGRAAGRRPRRPPPPGRRTRHTAAQHRVDVGEQHDRARASSRGDRPPGRAPPRDDAGRQRALRRALDGRPVGDRIGKRDADLDDVGAARGRAPARSSRERGRSGSPAVT